MRKTLIKRHFPLLLGISLALFPPTVFCQEVWEDLSPGLAETNLSLIRVSRSNPAIAFAGTTENLYRSLDGGKHWEKIFRAAGEDNALKALYFDEKDRALYLLGRDGTYLSKDLGQSWNRIFPAGPEVDSIPAAFSTHPHDPEVLTLGTRNGLYWSLDQGRRWIRESGRLGQGNVSAIFQHPAKEELLFVATDTGLYRTGDSGAHFEKSFHLPKVFEEGEDPVERSSFASIRAIEVSPLQENLIFLGTDRGIWISTDEGRHWEEFPESGLPSRNVKDLEISPRDGMLFVSTDAGVFYFDRREHLWRRIVDEPFHRGAAQLSLSSGETEVLYVASDSGLFRWSRDFTPIEIPAEYSTLSTQSLSDVALILEREPTILEVQRATVRTAGLGSSKTRFWSWRAGLRSVVPRVSVSQDLSVTPNIQVDQGSTKDPDTFIIGPEETRRSQDLNLTWDLADLIWNRDQVSIDSRANSRTQLRDQLLSEVTRLYFERRRLLLELYFNRPAGSKSYFELLLRIDELTAQIDALTGGFLTRELEKRRIQYS